MRRALEHVQQLEGLVAEQDARVCLVPAMLCQGEPIEG